MRTVADEILWDSLPADVKRIAESYVEERIDAARERGFDDGWANGDSAGYQRGFEAGVIEGGRRERSKKEDAA